MSDLDLTRLPDLPQSATIAQFAPRIWDDARVVALWLGGSLARGSGDPYSDVDLRLAVHPDDLDAWHAPDLATLVAGAVVGSHQLRFGADALLHHLALASDDLLDFLVLRNRPITPAAPVRNSFFLRRFSGTKDPVCHTLARCSERSCASRRVLKPASSRGGTRRGRSRTSPGPSIRSQRHTW